MRPDLEFCDEARNLYNISDIKDLKTIQRRATKLFPCLRPLQWLKGVLFLKYRNYKMHNDLNHLKLIISNNLAPTISKIGPANRLRDAVKTVSREIISSLICRIQPDLNILPDHINNAFSVNSFKIKILLNSLVVVRIYYSDKLSR